MEANDGARKLDMAAKASMDEHAMNNLVVSLKSVVKKSRVLTCQRLITQMKKLGMKRSKDIQKARNERKVARLSQEVHALKKILPDKLVKHCLANTYTLQDLQRLTDPKTRAIVRVASHSSINPSIQTWRDSHEDWQSLATYILHKTTSRQYKKSKQEIQALIGDEKKMCEEWLKSRRRAGGGVSSNLQEVMSSINEEKGSLEEESSSDNEEDSLGRSKRKKKISEKSNVDGNTMKHVKGSKQISAVMKLQLQQLAGVVSRNSSMEDSGSDSESETENETVDSSDGGMGGQDDERGRLLGPFFRKKLGSSSDNEEETEEEQTEEEQSEEEQTEEEQSDDLESGESPDESSNYKAHSDGKKSANKLSSKLKTINKSEKANKDSKSALLIDDDGETIVKKFNLNTLTNDEEDLDFLVGNESNNRESVKQAIVKEKNSSKKGDSFFLGSGSESDSDSDHSQSEEVDKSHDLDVNSKHSGLESKKKIPKESTFLGSLSGSKAQNRKRGQGHSQTHGKGQGYSRDQGRMTGPSRGRTNPKGRGSSNSAAAGRPGGKAMSKAKDAGGKTNSNAKNMNVSKRAASGSVDKLHPSWLASKKRKEQSSIQAFEGKKITFDD